MSAGFRSWLAGVIGRFSSTPGTPPPSSSDGVGISDPQTFGVLFATNRLGIPMDKQTFGVCYDNQEFRVTSAIRPMPLIYGTGKRQ